MYLKKETIYSKNRIITAFLSGSVQKCEFRFLCYHKFTTEQPSDKQVVSCN